MSLSEKGSDPLAATRFKAFLSLPERVRPLFRQALRTFNPL